jgi:hypothetical protein
MLVLGCELWKGLFSGDEGIDRGLEEGIRVGSFRERRVCLEEGGLDGLGLVRYEVDEALVSWVYMLAQKRDVLYNGLCTLEQGLEVG